MGRAGDHGRIEAEQQPAERAYNRGLGDMGVDARVFSNPNALCWFLFICAHWSISGPSSYRKGKAPGDKAYFSSSSWARLRALASRDVFSYRASTCPFVGPPERSIAGIEPYIGITVGELSTQVFWYEAAGEVRTLM